MGQELKIEMFQELTVDLRRAPREVVSAILFKRLAGIIYDAGSVGEKLPASSSRRSRPSQDYRGRTARRAQGRAILRGAADPCARAPLCDSPRFRRAVQAG